MMPINADSEAAKVTSTRSKALSNICEENLTSIEHTNPMVSPHINNVDSRQDPYISQMKDQEANTTESLLGLNNEVGPWPNTLVETGEVISMQANCEVKGARKERGYETITVPKDYRD
jgi:hypothetical protein